MLQVKYSPHLFAQVWSLPIAEKTAWPFGRFLLPVISYFSDYNRLHFVLPQPQSDVTFLAVTSKQNVNGCCSVYSLLLANIMNKYQKRGAKAAKGSRICVDSQRAWQRSQPISMLTPTVFVAIARATQVQLIH